MRYIIEVHDLRKIYYFYPSPYGDIMTNDLWKALSVGFESIEEAKNFFNRSQKSFRDLFHDCIIFSVKIVGVRASMEDACNLI